MGIRYPQIASQGNSTRHKSVRPLPYNKSSFVNKRRNRDANIRTFFKGAAEYLIDINECNNSLADKDYSVKRIVSDQSVEQSLNESIRLS